MTDKPIQSETDLNKHVAMLSVGMTRLFRNNIGAYKDPKGNWVKYGVCNPGGSDFIGWHAVTITPEMVGCTVPVFMAVENKFGKNKPTDDQVNFINAVRKFGGISVVAYSVDDVKVAIQLWQPKKGNSGD